MYIRETYVNVPHKSSYKTMNTANQQHDYLTFINYLLIYLMFNFKLIALTLYILQNGSASLYLLYTYLCCMYTYYILWYDCDIYKIDITIHVCVEEKRLQRKQMYGCFLTPLVSILALLSSQNRNINTEDWKMWHEGRPTKRYW